MPLKSIKFTKDFTIDTSIPYIVSKVESHP